MLTQEQEQFLDALEKALGVLSLALQKTETPREVYDGWLRNNTFKVRVENINELSIDFVENKLLKKIQQDDLNAIQFYLKTKGKKRGY
jgi:hypothetical protein